MDTDNSTHTLQEIVYYCKYSPNCLYLFCSFIYYNFVLNSTCFICLYGTIHVGSTTEKRHKRGLQITNTINQTLKRACCTALTTTWHHKQVPLMLPCSIVVLLITRYSVSNNYKPGVYHASLCSNYKFILWQLNTITSKAHVNISCLPDLSEFNVVKFWQECVALKVCQNMCEVYSKWMITLQGQLKHTQRIHQRKGTNS